MVACEELAGAGSLGCGLLVLDRGVEGMLRFVEPVVVLAENRLPSGCGFVTGSLPGLGLLTHPLAKLLVGEDVRERRP
ncbi:hypothetical protein [Kitasatospora sp. NPDC085879]|uniref:hypothetical protein n=1 Tax=Kitasatospora sp. NPDC085879 TaxID=3154769 RepID=UPI00341B5048